MVPWVQQAVKVFLLGHHVGKRTMRGEVKRVYCPGHLPRGEEEEVRSKSQKPPTRPPGWAQAGLHVWNWKYLGAGPHLRIQGVHCCLSSFPRSKENVIGSMVHHYNHSLTPTLNPLAHLLLHYTHWGTLNPGGIQLLDHLAPALTLTP